MSGSLFTGPQDRTPTKQSMASFEEIESLSNSKYADQKKPL